MSDIRIKKADTVITEGVMINPKVSAADRVIKNDKDEIINVIQGGNIISTGRTGREAVRNIYGKI